MTQGWPQRIYSSDLRPWHKIAVVSNTSKLCVQPHQVNPPISILRARWCPCPIWWDWQQQATSTTGSPSVSVLRVNIRQAAFNDIVRDTFGPRLSCPSALVVLGQWLIWYRTWRTVYIHAIWAAGCEGLLWYPQCQVSRLVKTRMFRPGLRCHRSSGSWCSHCGGAATGQRRSDTFRYHGVLPSGRRATYTLPPTLNEKCLVVRKGKVSWIYLGHTNFVGMAPSQPQPKHSMPPR